MSVIARARRTYHSEPCRYRPTGCLSVFDPGGGSLDLGVSHTHKSVASILCMRG